MVEKFWCVHREVCVNFEDTLRGCIHRTSSVRRCHNLVYKPERCPDCDELMTAHGGEFTCTPCETKRQQLAALQEMKDAIEEQM